MGNHLINLSEFEPIVNMIDEATMDPSNKQIWISIYIPQKLNLDIDKCKLIFENDLQVITEVNSSGSKRVKLQGTVAIPEIATFLFEELKRRNRQYPKVCFDYRMHY